MHRATATPKSRPSRRTVLGGPPTPNSMNAPHSTSRAPTVARLVMRSGAKDAFSDPAGASPLHTNGSCPVKPADPAPLRRVPDHPLLKGNLVAPPPADLRYTTTGCHRTNCPAPVCPPGLSRNSADRIKSVVAARRSRGPGFGPPTPSTDPAGLERTPTCDTERACHQKIPTKGSTLYLLPQTRT